MGVSSNDRASGRSRELIRREPRNFGSSTLNQVSKVANLARFRASHSRAARIGVEAAFDSQRLASSPVGVYFDANVALAQCVNLL
jgi:hypothetical protein